MVINISKYFYNLINNRSIVHISFSHIFVKNYKSTKLNNIHLVMYSFSKSILFMLQHESCR